MVSFYPCFTIVHPSLEPQRPSTRRDNTGYDSAVGRKRMLWLYKDTAKRLRSDVTVPIAVFEEIRNCVEHDATYLYDDIDIAAMNAVMNGYCEGFSENDKKLFYSYFFAVVTYLQIDYDKCLHDVAFIFRCDPAIVEKDRFYSEVIPAIINNESVFSKEVRNAATLLLTAM